MKASELVQQLQELIKKKGDCEILIDDYQDDGSGGEVHVPQVWHEDQLEDADGIIHNNIIAIGK